MTVPLWGHIQGDNGHGTKIRYDRFHVVVECAAAPSEKTTTASLRLADLTGADGESRLGSIAVDQDEELVLRSESYKGVIPGLEAFGFESTVTAVLEDLPLIHSMCEPISRFSKPPNVSNLEELVDALTYLVQQSLVVIIATKGLEDESLVTNRAMNVTSTSYEL